MKRLMTFAALALTAPSAALAHIVTTPDTVAAGSHAQVGFRVGHGCGGEATTAIRIEMPAGVGARARPVPGWTLAMEKSKDGRTTAITWRGRLPDSEFQLFELLFTAPVQTGPLTFPILQHCGAKEAKWSPVVTIVPAADPHAGHH
jgi:periplasmic copper chaperone A